MRKSLSLLMFLIPYLGYSQDTLKNKDLNEVQVVSIRADVETPVTQTNLKKDRIYKNYSGQDMSYILLNNVPSLTSYSDNGLYNSYTYFRLRGVDQTRINMTLNGIPLNEPEDQGVYFSNYPDFGANINSIQIQRGVGSSSYGSSSYIGSINFEGPNLLDSNWTSLESGYGSFNSYRMSVAHNSGLKNKVAVYARYSMIGSDGYRYNSFNKSRTFFTSVGYYDKKDIIKLTAFSGQSNNGMAYLATSIDDINIDPRTNYLTRDEQDLFEQNFTSLQWIRNINDNSHINTSIFYNHLDGNYDILFSDTIPSTNDMYKFRLKSNFYGVMSTYNYTKNKVKFLFGVNASFYERYHMNSNYPNHTNWFYTNKGIKNEVSSFVKLYYNITNKLVAYGDIQYRNVIFNYVPDKSNTTDLKDITWTFLNPKGGLRFNHTKNISYYTSVGMNHREPTRNDLFNGYDDVTPIDDYRYVGFGVDTIDIRSIKPERVIDFEIGSEWRSDKLFIQLNGYYMDFKNEIAQIGQISYIGLPLRKNVSSSFRSGVEFDMNWLIVKGLIFSQNLNYSYNKINEYTTDYDSVTYRNVSPLLTPNFVSNTSISYNYKWVTLGINGRYVSKSYLDNTQNDNYVTPDFFLLDSYVQFDIKGLSLRVSVNNIANQRYFTGGYVTSTSSYYIGAPRNFYFTLNYKF